MTLISILIAENQIKTPAVTLFVAEKVLKKPSVSLCLCCSQFHEAEQFVHLQ